MAQMLWKLKYQINNQKKKQQEINQYKVKDIVLKIGGSALAAWNFVYELLVSCKLREHKFRHYV